MFEFAIPNYQFCPLCGTPLESKNDGEKERKFCPKDKWVYYPRMAVSCGALIVEDDKILLVKRNREPFIGKWMLPSGFLEFGESPEEGIKREVFEETGLKVRELKLDRIAQSVDDFREPGHYYIVYRVIVEKGKLKNDDVENQGIEWWRISEIDIEEIAFVAHRNVIAELKK